MTESPRVLVLFGNVALYGKERANIQVFKILREQGIDALFVTDRKRGHAQIQPALDAAGFSWAPVTMARPLRLGAMRSVWKAPAEMLAGWRDLRKVIQEYQPTHIHVPNEWQYIFNMPVLRAAKVPILYRLGDAPSGTPGARSDWFYRSAWRWWIAPSVDQFVCVSKYVYNRLIEAGAPRDKTRVIYTFPPERTPRDHSDLPSDLLDTSFEGRTVTYMGQIAEHKGVDLLIESAIDICSRTPNVRFLLAGDMGWNESLTKGLLASVDNAGLKNRIRFLGYVEDIPGLLAITDIHTAPSVWEEPLANTVLEAKRAAVPSVLFPSGGLPEIVVSHGHDAYLCCQKAASDLTEGLEHYIDMDDASMAFAKTAAQSSLYTLGITRDAFAQAWSDVYAAL